MSDKHEFLRFPSVIIQLEPWEYAHASDVGIRRFTANWDKQDARHYDRQRMEDDRTAQVAAAVCELAVAKYANRYWSGHVWHASEHEKYRDIPDVGHNIEVRRIRTGNTAAVRKHQLNRGLILFAAKPFAPEFTAVEIGGWLPYDEAWDLGEPSHYAPDTTRLVSTERMKI